MEIEMDWFDVKNLPQDEEVVFVINKKIEMLPMRAYYDKDYEEFISLECFDTHPLAVTHWCYLPNYPHHNW